MGGSENGQKMLSLFLRVNVRVLVTLRVGSVGENYKKTKVT